MLLPTFTQVLQKNSALIFLITGICNTKRVQSVYRPAKGLSFKTIPRVSLTENVLEDT